MYHWVFLKIKHIQTYRLNNDDFLEVHECKAGVSDQVSAFSAIQISLKG